MTAEIGSGLALAIVTCSPQLEVALGSPSMGVPSQIRLAGPSPRSTLIMAAVDLLVEDSGRSAEEIVVIGVTRGPGSFTGIRSGLATALGMAAALGCAVRAFDSLLVQAARVAGGRVWTAQPGRRGEVYAQEFANEPGGLPLALGGVRVLAVDRAVDLGPWVAAERTELGAAPRAVAGLTAAESVIRLLNMGAEGEAVEPKYIEGPPIHGAAGP